jgi:hypothetical protein
MHHMSENDKKETTKSATLFIFFMGLVSLLSDMTHEGATSISGAFFRCLVHRVRQSGLCRVWVRLSVTACGF